MALTIIAWLFFAAQAATLVKLRLAKFPYPYFLTVLCLWTLQALNLAFSDLSTSFWRFRWSPAEVVILPYVAMMVVEAVRSESKGLPDHVRFWVRSACFGAPVLIVGIAFRIFAPHDDDRYNMFLIVRDYLWVAFAVCLGAMRTFMAFQKEWRATSDRIAAFHAKVLAILVISHALTAPFREVTGTDWRTIQAVFRLVAIGCCAAWIFNPGWKPDEPQPDRAASLPVS